jgi:carbon-monoxide dehydrogenase medium subunit
MIPAAFDYARAGSAEEAVALLAHRGDGTRLLAGGHSLIPLMRLRRATPTALVDIGEIGELRYVRDLGDRLAIGGLTRYTELARDPVLTTEIPFLAEAAGAVADPQVRRRGTVGGSLAHADPAADLPAVLLALDAEIVLRGPHGERALPAARFLTGPYTTAARPDEMLTEVRVPKPQDGRYAKFSRRTGGWAIVSAVAVRWGTEAASGSPVWAGGTEGASGSVGGRSSRVDTEGASGRPPPEGAATRVVLGGMGPTALRAPAVEAALAAGADAEDAAQLADRDTDPPADLNASAGYRRHLARVLTRRVLAATAQHPLE